MKPSVGRVVLYKFGMYEPQENGADVAPAIITRVWSDTCVNLQVFVDNGVVEPRMSSMLLSEMPEGVVNSNSGWSWPPRVEAPGAVEQTSSLSRFDAGQVQHHSGARR